MAKNRYFMAVVLRNRALADAEAIKEELLGRFGLKGALRSPAHITLHRPFEWKSEKEEELINSIGEFKFGETFDLHLKGFAHFSDRVIYIDVPLHTSLFSLHDRLARFAQQKLHLLNEVNDMRGFHPHVTVAFRDLRRNRFPEVWRWIAEKNFDHTLRVEGFSLLRLDDKWREVRFFSDNDNI